MTTPPHNTIPPSHPGGCDILAVPKKHRPMPSPRESLRVPNDPREKETPP